MELRRRRNKINWGLVTCGKKGHALVGTDAAEVRPKDSLVVRTAGPLRWYRCLRCDSWVPLSPPPHPTRDHPPERDEIVLPLRGKALRDRVVLRLIALDRVIHFLILGLLGIAVLFVAANRGALRSDYYRVLTALQGGVAGGPVQTTGHVGFLHELDRLFSLRTAALTDAGIAILLYALLEGVEAVGLWLGKRWAEYLTFLATTILLPLEVYEIVNKVSILKVLGFLLNVVIVVYLLLAKRLFGLRGGGAADRAEREHDMGWEAIARDTPAELAPVG